MTEAVQEAVPGAGDLIEEASKAKYHTLLEIWTELLKPAESERHQPIAPQWANKIVSTYNGMSFQDMGDFRARYFDKIQDLSGILAGVVSEDDEALKRISPEEDATLNRHHYLTLLYAWQQQILTWELEWYWADPSAAAELAAISEVHKMFFSEQGITAHLDEIGFQFDDIDRQALVEMLEETRKDFR